MRWHAAHLSGVAPVSTTCGPPSAEAVPPLVPRPASNATATPATPPSSTAFFIFHLISSAPAEKLLPGRRPPEGGEAALPPVVIATYCTLLWHLRHIPRLSIFSMLARAESPGIGVGTR